MKLKCHNCQGDECQTPCLLDMRTKTGRVERLNSIQRNIKGVTFHGKTKGVKMLETATRKVARSFHNATEKMFEELIEDLEI